MKKIFLSIIVLSLFGLFGCKKDEPVLLGPSNVSFNEETKMLPWDEEVGAVGYKILINKETVESKTNSYDLKAYQPGEYKVRIRSIFKNKESNFGEQVTFYIPENFIIYISDNKIYLTKMDNAEYKYSLRVDHNKVENTNTTGIINIPNEFRDRVINFELNVYIRDVLRYKVVTDISLILNNTFKGSDLEIPVNNPKAVYIDGEAIEATLSKDKVIISKEVIDSLGSEVILAVSGDTYIIKKLYVTDPFVVLTSKKIINETEELKFTFDLNGFKFIEIAKKEFSLGVDYFFDEGILTFSDNFISKYKELYPDSKNIYLMAVFRRGSETVLINITIKLDA